ncbi:MAG: hypothetical protein R3D56_11500 [Paracoccaceae bacterium]
MSVKQEARWICALPVCASFVARFRQHKHYFGRKIAVAAVPLFFLNSPPELGAMARAEAAPENCSENKARNSLPAHPIGRMAFLFGFEHKIPAAFPAGSSETILKNWLRNQNFTFNERSQLDSAFADEPDEIARFRARLKSGELVNLSIRSISTLCGRAVYSVGWSADECGLIKEIYADAKYCQFDLP